MKKKKNVFILVILLLLVVTSVVAVTYSRYISSATGTATAKVATWAVNVNETDIVSTKTFSLDGSYVTWSNSNKIADGYIAPGRSGIMKIKLNTAGSKVAVKYTISVDTSAIDEYSQIKVAKVNGVVLTNGTYTNTIALADVDKELEIPIEIVWENADSNNESDTTIGSSVPSFSIPVTVTVEQDVAA